MERKYRINEIGIILLAAALCIALAACTRQNIPENKAEIFTETQPHIAVSPKDLAGTWHLDNEKNDLDALTAAWETFPGYAEWGAGMEIRSSGQMSWYIGAVGGSGTYAIEGDLLHAELIDTMEQKQLTMDLCIAGAGELKMSYADRQFVWVCGDQVDVFPLE